MKHFEEEQCYCYSDRGNELVFTDEYLYKNIDKVLQTKNLTYVLINFSNAPVQEELLIKLSQVKTLVKLELSFIGSNITIIPDAIFNITSLKVLLIQNITTTELSSKISNLKNLEILQVYGTYIETIPESISELTKLKELDMPTNCITHLPSSIGSLIELEDIMLVGNVLSDIPESMCNLKKLKILQINSNDLALITSNNLAKLKDNNPTLKLFMTELNSEEYFNQIRHEKIIDFFNTLNASLFIFDSFDSLQNACREIIKIEFGNDDEDIYIQNVRSLRMLLTHIQPWH